MYTVRHVRGNALVTMWVHPSEGGHRAMAVISGLESLSVPLHSPWGDQHTQTQPCDRHSWLM